MNTNTLRRAVSIPMAVAMGVLLLVGCSDKEKPLQTRSQEDASQQVEAYFQAQSTTVHGQPDAGKKTGIGPAPCEGKGGETADDERYYIQGTYQLPFPTGQTQQTVVDTLQKSWNTQGYEYPEPLNKLPSGDLSVTARNPRDGFQISITGYEKYVGVLIFSPCYQPPKIGN
ncbi:hypothetical protein [Longispora urticae]